MIIIIANNCQIKNIQDKWYLNLKIRGLDQKNLDNFIAWRQSDDIII